MVQDIRIYAKGLAFSEGVYNLRILEKIITNYRIILDRLVAVQLGKKKVSSDLKSQLNYDVRINEDSIELLINFALEHKEYIAAFAPDGGAGISNIIVNLLRDSVKLREVASKFMEKGLPININISNNFNIGSRINNTNVSYDDNAGKIIINDPRILWAAQVTRAPVNNLLSKIDGKVVENITISNEDDDFGLTPGQHNIIGRNTEQLPTTLKLIGRLDMVAFSAHRGSVISDNGKFSVTWDDLIRPKMQKLADIEGIVFRVRPVIDHKRLDGEAIGFHVLDCENPQEVFKGI
jgi:hypothetical protein